MKSSKNQQGFTVVELLSCIVILIALVGHGFNIYLLQQAYADEIWVEVVIRGIAFVLFPFGWVFGFVPL